LLGANSWPSCRPPFFPKKTRKCSCSKSWANTCSGPRIMKACTAAKSQPPRVSLDGRLKFQGLKEYEGYLVDEVPFIIF
jgi:hypothetical protein